MTEQEIVEGFFEFRRAMGLSIRDAARLLSVSPSFLYRVEAQERKPQAVLLTRMIFFMEKSSSCQQRE
jgi:transcriptional regulator with XRE-family HTH domain